jgi:hypothetical protein
VPVARILPGCARERSPLGRGERFTDDLSTIENVVLRFDEGDTLVAVDRAQPERDAEERAEPARTNDPT